MLRLQSTTLDVNCASPSLSTRRRAGVPLPVLECTCLVATLPLKLLYRSPHRLDARILCRYLLRLIQSSCDLRPIIMRLCGSSHHVDVLLIQPPTFVSVRTVHMMGSLIDGACRHNGLLPLCPVWMTRRFPLSILVANFMRNIGSVHTDVE